MSLQLATQVKTVVVQVLPHSDEEEFDFLSAPAERSGEESHADPLKSGPELSCCISALAAHKTCLRVLLTSEEGACFF